MNTVLTDMSGAYIEHSEVITNFVSVVHSQLKNSTCKVFPDNVQYKWMVDGESRTVIPDATINCRVHHKKGNSFFDIPRFVMEVVSTSTEKYDRGEKMELYRQQEVDEYWIVDWRKRQVEIYNLDYDENQEARYFLWQTVTEANKDELRIVHFPNVKIKFDELFDGVDE
jgi:Uma2 family endonuclease